MARTKINVGQMSIAADFTPATANGAALGSSSAEWSDLYLADGGIIKLGADQDVTLTHVADTGVLLNSSRQLQFGDAATHIKQVTDGNLEIEADTSIQLDSPIVDFQDDGVILNFGADDDVTLTHIADAGLRINSGMALQFADAGEKIAGDGTDLTLSSGGDIKLTATANVEATLSGTQKLTFDGATGNTYLYRENAGTGGEILEMKALKGLRLTTAGTANQIDVKLGSGDANSAFKVLNSADGAMFQVDGDGDVVVGKDLVVNGTSIDVDGASALTIGATVGANNLTLGASTSTVIVAGNLTVQGTTTQVDSTTINITSSFTFEGPADAHETILTAATPASDTTIQLPEFTTAATYYMAAFQADPGATGWITSTPTELNLLDGCGAGTVVNSKAVIYSADGDVVVGDNLTLDSDAAVIQLGDDQDVTITHVADTGIRLNSAMKLQFRDATEFVHSDADGYMHMEGATGVNLAINGTDELAITATTATFGTNLMLPNSSTIGCAADSDLITLADGIVTVAGEVQVTTLDIGGTNVGCTAGELNLLDGSAKSTASITIDDADAFVIIDGNTTKQIPASDLKTYAAGGVTAGDGLQDSSDTFSITFDREVWMSGAVGTTGAEYQFTRGMTASLQYMAVSATGLQVFLNGMLLTPSGSHAGADQAGSQTFDYKYWNTGAPPGLSSNTVYLESAVDSDDVLVLQYVRQ